MRRNLAHILLISLAGIVTTGLILAQSGAGRPEYVEGEVLVRFKPGVHENAAWAAAAEHSLRVRRKFRLLSEKDGQLRLHLVSATLTTQDLMARLQKDRRVEVVSPNYVKRLDYAFYPNDTYFSDQWSLHNTGQEVNGVWGTPDADIDAPEAWRLCRQSTGDVVVAVVDGGVYYTHQDLAGSMWINAGENATNNLDNDSNGYTNDVYGYDFSGDWGAAPDPCPMDVTWGSHGTHVAGLIAAVANNSRGVAGVCRTKIMALKATSDGEYMDDASCIDAIGYACMMKGRGVPVVAINLSYGAAGASNEFEVEAIRLAGETGIVVCAAAGNHQPFGNDNDAIAYYPACYALSNIIAVAATDSSDLLASYSNYGRNSVDLAAPGDNMLSTVYMDMLTYGTVTVTGTNFSGTVRGFEYAGTTTGLTAQARYCGQGYPTNFNSMTRGTIAVMERDSYLSFREQAQNAMNTGAVAVIIYNNAAGWIDDFDATLVKPKEWIPAVHMTMAEGSTLASCLPTKITLSIPADWDFMDGTSMSCPIVAGAVAMMAMQFPDDTVSQRISRILTSVDKKAGLTSKVATGGRLNLLNAMDTDKDGIADWWEQMYFSSLTNANANTDADGDGFTDYAEFYAGTVPTNGDSLLKILSPPAAGTNGLTIMWSSVSNTTYALQRATNMTAAFGGLATSIVGNPPTNVYTDGSATNYQSLFYRILVE